MHNRLGFFARVGRAGDGRREQPPAYTLADATGGAPRQPRRASPRARARHAVQPSRRREAPLDVAASSGAGDGECRAACAARVAVSDVVCVAVSDAASATVSSTTRLSTPAGVSSARRFSGCTAPGLRATASCIRRAKRGGGDAALTVGSIRRRRAAAAACGGGTARLSESTCVRSPARVRCPRGHGARSVA